MDFRSDFVHGTPLQKKYNNIRRIECFRSTIPDIPKYRHESKWVEYVQNSYVMIMFILRK